MRLLHLFLLFVFQLQISASISTKLEETTFSIPAPTGVSPQSDCQQSDGSFPFTLADLAVFNTQGYSEIFWFTDANQNTALPVTTNIVDGYIYYAFQAVDPSAASLEVKVQMTPYIPAPVGELNQYFTEGCTFTLADAAVFNTAGYTDIYWFC